MKTQVGGLRGGFPRNSKLLSNATAIGIVVFFLKKKLLGV